MLKYCTLFYSFLKIGGFTVGGGYAMVPLMEREFVERRGWLSHDEFLDYLSLAQAMPGVFAVNMATLVGYKLCGVRGSVVAIVGNIILPVVFIVLLAMFFRTFRHNPYVNSIFLGLRPAVVALIAAPVFNMARRLKLSWRNVWIPILAALLIWLFGVSPVIVILVAAVGGFVWGKMSGKSDKSDGLDKADQSGENTNSLTK
ncbi:MAG: chromate transporter [Bacteroidales bacterium]|nr:chromate transporter [Bacteroidales bacterium]